MDELIKQVRKARRRLMLQRFLAALVQSLFVTLAPAAVAIGIQKWLLTNVDGWHWAVCWLVGAVGTAIIAAAVWTWMHRLPELEAAIEIDRRFGLKERVSSALALTAGELQTPFGRALMDDARGRVDKLEVVGRFPIGLERRAWLPLIPATAAFALCLSADPTRPMQADANANTVAVKQQIDESVKPLQSKLAERAKQAADAGLKDAEDLFKKLEAGTRDLAKKDETDRHEATAKLNDLAQQLEQRRGQLAEGERLKEQLAGMKNLPGGPADKLAQELKNGDFDKALQEIEKLQAQLSQGQLDPDKQKQLAEQFNAMKLALETIADAQQKTEEELQRQLALAIKAGNQDAAKKLQQQLQKLGERQQQMDQLEKMASMFGQASREMKSGDTGQAQAVLSEMAQDLTQSQQELAEMEMLETTLDEIDDAKFAINCPLGSSACRNGEDRSTKPGSSAGGDGQIPDALGGSKFFDSKVKQEIGHGAAAITGLVDGPNAKGQVAEEIKSEMEAAKHDSSDPLTGQRLPRQERDHVQQYFDAFRQGP
ncbi:MAG TPA: hypothetical protein VMJ32_12680 [Pirellulales bacterium]|nr:hypothetical protein [Pirellulales bacterium]